MTNPIYYRIAADLVLAIHMLFVLFVILGLFFILAGGVRGWLWVKNPWFRLGHLLSIGLVVVLSWFQAICPLTTIEMAMRSRAGDAVYSGSFIAHWLETLLYYDAPKWVFALGYTVFGLLVLACWIAVPPRRMRPGKKADI